MRLLNKNGYGIVKSQNHLSYMTGDDYYEFNFEEISEITLNKYLENKYGKENTKWTKPFYEVANLANGEFLTVFYQESIIRHHQKNGEIISESDKIHSPLGCGVYGITLDKDENLWIAVPSEHYIGKFNYKTGEEFFSICGTAEMEPGLFNHPENVISIEDKIYVCDMGNKRVVMIKSKTNEIVGQIDVDEHIYYYNKDENGEYFLLSSGLHFKPKSTS